MKKAIKMFSILFFIVVALTFSSCKANRTSSAHNNIQNSDTLLRRISATDDLNNIENISILSGTDSNGAILTDKSAFEFLPEYTYSHTHSDRREIWDKRLTDATDVALAVSTKTCGIQYIYLINDGSIAIQVMCGDSEVPELSYDFYTADNDNMLTKEKLELLSKEE